MYTWSRVPTKLLHVTPCPLWYGVHAQSNLWNPSAWSDTHAYRPDHFYARTLYFPWRREKVRQQLCLADQTLMWRIRICLIFQIESFIGVSWFEATSESVVTSAYTLSVERKRVYTVLWQVCFNCKASNKKWKTGTLKSKVIPTFCSIKKVVQNIPSRSTTIKYCCVPGKARHRTQLQQVNSLRSENIPLN